jgi:hypothetical protein
MRLRDQAVDGCTRRLRATSSQRLEGGADTNCRSQSLSNFVVVITHNAVVLSQSNAHLITLPALKETTDSGCMRTVGVGRPSCFATLIMGTAAQSIIMLRESWNASAAEGHRE